MMEGLKSKQTGTSTRWDEDEENTMGRYNGFGDWQALETDMNLLAEFEATGFDGASKLRNAGRIKSGQRHKDTGYEMQVHYSDYFNKDNNENVTSIAGAFQAWKEKFLKTKADHEAFVKLSKEAPGRSATILTPMSGPESKTLLGATNPAAKTVLG